MLLKLLEENKVKQPVKAKNKMNAKKKALRRQRIKKGIRKKIFGTADRPRLSVYRSNTSIYAQIIDDERSLTLASASSRIKSIRDSKGTKVEKSEQVGKTVAQLASKVGIKSVVFDRNGYRYHGRVKSLADGARSAGLEF